MSYPKVLYHKELAADGQLIKSAEAEAALSEGWVDTPEAFEEGYVKPAPVTDAKGHVQGAPVVGHIHRPFPSARYNKAGAEKVVRTQEEADALDPSVWKDTNDPAAFPADAPAAAAPPATPPPSGKSKAELHKAELYSAKVADVAEKVATATDVDTLQLILGFELANPSGARVGVTKAVKKRLVELGAALPDDDKK